MSDIKTPEKKPAVKKPINKAIIIALIVSALVLVYVVIGLFFTNRFYIGTKINGISASFATPEAMSERIEDAAKGYSITITKDGKDVDVIRGDEIGLKLDSKDGEIESFLSEQKGYDWLLKVFSPSSYVGEKLVSYDKMSLHRKVKELSVYKDTNVSKTKDATYEYNSSKEAFEVVDEVYGTEVEPLSFAKKVGDLILLLSDKADMDENQLYKQPQVTKDSPELLSHIDSMNSKIDITIAYDEGSKVTKSDIASWIDLDENKQIVYNEELIDEFVKTLAEKYDTLGKSKTLKTSYGDVVTVPAGNYGWKVDKTAEKEQLISDLKNGENVNREIVYQYTAASHGDNDYGNSYVEANLTKQHLFLYIDGKQVLDTPFVSGNLARGNGTHTGAFRIAYTQRNAILRGRDYATPVSYWMPFNGGEGLHDANWRATFGGNIFRTNGSHGCVNLPFNAAKTIFGYVKAGFPVLVYSTGGTDNTNTAISQETANSVIGKIAAIGEVTLDSATMISDARKAYETLADKEKAKVTNIDVLVAAEAALATLQNQPVPEVTPTPEPAPEPTPEPIPEPTPEPTPEPESPPSDAPVSEEVPGTESAPEGI